MSEPGRGPAPPDTGAAWLRVAAAALALAAIALPQSWLVGAPEPGDPRDLAFGSWLLRGALLALAAFLESAPRFERRADGPPRDASPAGTGARWIAAIVAVAVALRAFRLDAPMWFDEIWMLVDSVRPPLPDTLRSFETDNNHPLYTFLATLCVRTFGESAWALRLPAAAFGAASVWATWEFARRRLGGATALAAAAALALAWIHVDFSQNARAYTGLLLFTVLGSHALLTALETGSRRAWIVHGISLALCVALHLTGVFTAVGHLAVIAWYAWRKPAALAAGGLRAASLGFVLATLTAFAAYALVLPQVVHFFLLRPDRVAIEAQWTDPLWLVTETADRLGFGRAAGLALLAAGGAVGVAGLVAAGRRLAALPILLLVPAAATGVVMIGLGRNLWPRLFFAGAAFGVLVAIEGAVAAARLAGRAFRSGRLGSVLEKAVPFVLVVACAATLPRAYALPKQDFESALRWIRSERRPGEPVLAVGVMTRFVYEKWLPTDFVFVETPSDLDAAIPRGTSGYAVYSLPEFVRSRLPGLWRALEAEGREVARFRGSMGDGDVVVLRIER